MNSKEDIKGMELLDMLEQSESPGLSDFQALLSDEESAEDARLILEYRLAKAKTVHSIDTDREWKRFFLMQCFLCCSFGCSSSIDSIRLHPIP